MAQLEKGVQYGPYGRQTPTTFNLILDKTDKIKTITISSGSVVDGIGFEIVDQLGNSNTVWNGGQGHVTSTITLQDIENITQISGSVGDYGGDGNRMNVAQIRIHTNLAPGGYGPYGIMEGCRNISSFESPAGRVVGFFGATGGFVQSIGVSVSTDS